MTRNASQDSHVPPFRYRFLTPLYDLFCVLLGLGGRFRQRVLASTPINTVDKVLDIGCGTGTMSRLMKKRAPRATVIGIDPDEQALEIARKKAQKANLDITYIEGTAEHLPFPDHTFDLITSTLVFHHLPGHIKVAALREIRRVLKPGGHFALADFGRPKHAWLSPLPWLGAVIEEGKENYRGELRAMISAAGFTDIRVLARPRANIDAIVSAAPRKGEAVFQTASHRRLPFAP